MLVSASLQIGGKCLIIANFKSQSGSRAESEGKLKMDIKNSLENKKRTSGVVFRAQEQGTKGIVDGKGTVARRKQASGLRRRGRMKFDENVKALRLCGETKECISERIGCPYCENTDDCKRELLFDAADIIEAQQQEIDRLQRWVNDLQSGMYVNCVYCGHRYGMEKDTPVAMADVLKEHIEHCSKHPMSKLKQEIEQLRDENISIRNWNACEEEQYGQLLESDKRRIKLEEQIEAQQQEIKQLEYTLKKARDLIENANSNGILEHVARNCMFIKEIDDLLGGEKDE
jgi:DNA-directed RNA polymerase subunit RPC12/RpoP/cell division protein FtsB